MALLARSAETASSLQRQMTRREETSADLRHYHSPITLARRGCSLTEVLLGLENSKMFPKVVKENDTHKLFRQFVKDIVTKAIRLTTHRPDERQGA
ncbi:hypothetical protein ANCCAN_13114 [Ancylostoma caninum]|uniref:Uncharacterized protein n=1 Tax=Ancylostoma caninum TaxID=29170 RepID=A0A368GD76_ANCCA|nr:hypothetical protein ANCCAN_13114 [Ancylostoma caninum]